MTEIIIQLLILTASLIVIIKGGDIFVDAASWIAEVTGIPRLIVGATVVSFATTLPEVLASVFAASRGSAADAEMAIGNAIGSVTANTGLIMGIALICMPSIIKRSEYMLRSLLMLGSAMVLVISGLFINGINWIASIILLTLFVVAMWNNVAEAVKQMKHDSKKKETKVKVITTKKDVLINIVKFLIGAISIALGANYLVDSGSKIASILGVSQGIIAVTLVAIGTSLPELVTTITAIRKKQVSLSAGNIIGANIINLTMILPICCLVYGGPLPTVAPVKFIDFPACLLVGIVALIPTLINKKFAKWQGFTILGIYIAYLVVRLLATINIIPLS